MLSALEEATGAFPEAVSICEKLLHARGHVCPSTLDRVSLVAHTRDGRYIEGQAVACVRARPLLACSCGATSWRTHLRLRQSQRGPYRVRAGGPVHVHYPESAPRRYRCCSSVARGPRCSCTRLPICRARRGADCARRRIERRLWARHAASWTTCLFTALCPIKPDSSETGVFRAVTGANIGASRFVVDDEAEQRRVRPVRIDYADLRLIQSKGPVVIARNLVDPEHPTWHDPFALREAFTGVLRLCHSRRR